MKQTGAAIAVLLSGDQADAAKTALICDQGRFSYAQLDRWVGHLCSILSSQGVKPGMTIGYANENRLLNLLLLHAFPRLGCSFLPLNPSLPSTSLRQFLELGEADMLIAADTVVNSIPLLHPEQLLVADAHSETRHNLAAPLSAGQPHWLVATSGTQDGGKLVVLTGDQLMSSVRASRERLVFTRPDSWLLCLPMFHIGGLMAPLRCAEAGATLVLHESFDPVRLWDDLHKHEITHVSLVPAMLARLLEHYAGQSLPSNLRVMLIGGGALLPAMAQGALDAGWPLCPSYGMTEAASQVTTLYPPPSDYTAGMAGRPLSHLQVKIEPESGCIMIKGDSMMQGYAGREKRHNEWFVTNDLGQLDDQGELIVLGRADDVLISGGEKVHPQRVEQALTGCPGILDVAVTGIRDSVWGDRLVALYVGDLSSEALETWSRARLPGFMRPKEFVQVDALPRTPMGKLQRNKLPDLHVSKAGGW